MNIQACTDEASQVECLMVKKGTELILSYMDAGFWNGIGCGHSTISVLECDR